MSFQRTDTSILHLLKPHASKTPTFKSTLHLVLPPIKPAVISTTKLSVVKSDDKLLSNVQVYPNPVTDQINLKYAISRPSGVTIKIMDVLGNDIFTLFNQRVEPGQQAFSYSITNKLNQGFYFVRIIAGTESVIKRISVIPN
ncbi:MAG: T9SS type A sorting domain-containing protein [Bacteroidota bacterium]|nr:T9SS type A sorting domain-containing protein [Bacteroidota bacterium]